MDISDVERLGLPRLLSELAKAPTPEDPVPVTQLRRAGVHGWLQVQPLGPPSRSRSSLPQSSTATSCTSVARKVLKNWILMETTSGIRIQRHAFMHLACLISSMAVLG